MKKTLTIVAALLVGSCVFSQTNKLTEDGNAGVGTTSPSSYEHGGTNKVLEIHNPGTDTHSQSHVILSTSSTNPNSSIGSLTWAVSNAQGFKGVGFVDMTTGANSSATNPTGNMVFYTRASWDSYWAERMRIMDNGNVGIGTTSPVSKLDVTVNSNGLNLPIIARNLAGSENAGNSVGIGFLNESISNANWYKGAIIHERTGGYGIGKMHFLLNNSISGTSVTMADARMTITSGGNVGVGTTSPVNKLDVTVNSNGLNLPIIARNLAGNDNMGNSVGIGFLNEVNPNGNWYKGAIVHERVGGYGVGKMHFLLNNSISGASVTMADARMTITSDGNIGVGTTSPDSKLTVAGNIHSREVKVSVDAGADFVFQKDYNLKPLAEVAEYISANKHLPDVASADEMKKNGMELGEMNVKLLQKIEELTLHLIEQNKQNIEQNKRIDELEKQLKK